MAISGGRGKDMTGMKIGRLKVIGFDHEQRNNQGRIENYWKCQCECGNEKIVTTSVLTSAIRNNRMISCGCYVSERAGNIHRTHGLRHTRLSRIHHGMCGRCYSPTDNHYPRYGGRGIKVCDEWYTPGVHGNPGFVNFYNWAYANGYHDPEPGEERATTLSLERKDVNGPYAPWNCTWIPYGAQAYNRRNTKRIYDGERWYIHAEFEDTYGMYRGFVGTRLDHGWSESAIIYAARNPELGLYKLHPDVARKRGVPNDTYVDKDGFIHLIPIIHQPEYKGE